MTGKDERLSRTIQLDTGMAMTFACTPPKTADVVLFELLHVPRRPQDQGQPHGEV